jgi:hypothetical protein
VYELLSADQPIGTVRFNASGRISSIDLIRHVWENIRAAIEADSRTQRYGVVRSVLFSHRPLEGFARAPSWLQLRPVTCELRDATFGRLMSGPGAAGNPFPLVIEVRFRHSDLLLLDGHRRFRSIQEAQWLLSAFIDVPIFGFSGATAWAFLEGTYQLVTLGMATGLDQEPDTDFSSPAGLSELEPVPIKPYYSQLGITESKLRVPDLTNLYARYRALDAERQARFLRASASIWAAFQPGVSLSQRLVSLVSALEPLLDPPQRCAACKSAVGITKSFRRFLVQYVKPAPEVQYLYETIYNARSGVVHGSWNFEVDEPFMSIANQGYLTSIAAWSAAKQGVVNWLLAQ